MITKRWANYKKATTGRRCGTCKYYRRGKRCIKVKGRILPSYTCRLYEKRQKRKY